MEIPFKIVSYVINIAKEMGKIIIFNLSPATNIGDNLLKKIDFLVVNENELKFILKMDDNTFIKTENFKDVFNITKKLKINLVLTVGEKGSYYFGNDGSFLKSEPFNVNAVDSTASGDAFIGGFVFGLYKKYPIDKIMKIANAAGAYSVSHYGAQQSLPTKNDLKKLTEKIMVMY